MSQPSAAEPLVSGLATSIGSLPHVDPAAAASMVLRCHPLLPAAPQLPHRTPYEGMVAQWAGALPEVHVEPDGSLLVDRAIVDDACVATLDERAHAGLLSFVDAAAASDVPPRRIKVQLTGPLTLGMALHAAGMPADRAFERGAAAARSWVGAIESLVAERLPDTPMLLVFDEPALVAWRLDTAPIERELATDLLSSVLAVPTGTVGVHVCGAGDRRLAFEAGPKVLAFEVRPDLVDDADVISRHLEADGWIAWGAVPTDRPVGESAEPLWRALVEVWCELTKRGCDPVRLRTNAIVTPACGLAGHGPSQAERALRLAHEMADRVHSQTVAARLTVGA
jgi:methionine synthase II (cobalamin-independent)